jgi:hypothetical protein
VATYPVATSGVALFGRTLRMVDLWYVLGTVLFFAVMLAYVRGCERLGWAPDGEEREA